ncbi:S4 domain-containing protein [Peptoclostridium acidaminophilum DSM 3953]|uniref:S4 domain-containing protein n=1 Tax=Peptoclostridium acidaminophilum DSM 3953 TaxID=1286171 RepID=W8U2Y5_PEPAC|nr:S4 domain-containing protein YaaA [Peptoclostridium acidaminophilum]AHM55371.1 S4 domain-containing protein [Peptoclostridium acidaminophilum DSM 3953]
MKIDITSEYIKLDQLLKYAEVTSSGGESKIMIQNGEVKVNGEVETRRGKKIFPGDIVEVGGEKIEIQG